MNQIIIMGNVGNDPEVRWTAQGTAVTNLSVATSRRWTDKATGDKKEHTEWHRVVAFARQGETLGEHVKKGDKLLIVGRLQTKKWQDKTGNDRYTTEIITESFEFCGGKGGAKPQAGGFRDQGAPSDSGLDADFDVGDIPF